MPRVPEHLPYPLMLGLPKSFKARSALIDFKTQFSAAFQYAEATIGELESDQSEGKRPISDLA